MSAQSAAIDDDPVPTPANWDGSVFLRKVTDIVPSIIYVFNQQSQSNEYTNKSLASSLGYCADDIRELGADLMPRLCHPEDIVKIGRHFEEIKLLEDGNVASCEYRMRHKNGEWVWLLSHDTVFERARDGSVLRHIGVASDISAQKRAEQDAIDEKLRAKTTNDELRAFSYSMSHDMKAPSNTLNLLLNELLDTHRETLDPDAITLLDMALATVDRMGNIVDDVLTYTRVIDQDLDLAPVKLGALIEDLIQDLDTSIFATGARVEVGNIPDVVADAKQMRVLFQNLIENALKFCSPDVVPHIRIFAPPEADPKVCTITVKDNGIGIDPAKHDQIFTIFKRLNANMAFSGSGLGLAICRRIAANHGGKIALVSEPGRGAAFTIRLPTL